MLCYELKSSKIRPPEPDVTFILEQLTCVATEDAGGDEPYFGVEGIKVVADTIGPPPHGTFVPALNVQII